MGNKPSLAVCISKYEYGGQGTVVEEQLQHLSGEFSICLITEQIDRSLPSGVEGVELSAWSVFPRVNRQLARLLGTFDLIHCHDSLGFMHAAATSKLPYVVTCHGIAPLRFHGSPAAQLRGAVTVLTYPYLYRSAELVIGISDYISHWIHEFARVDAVTVSNGAPPVAGSQHGTPPRRNLLYVGEVSYRKGVHELIQALATTASDVELDIVGRSPNRRYRDSLSIKGLEERVRFHDELPPSQLRDLYGTCFATCSASFWEGFGLPIVEGFSQGRPAIVRKVGGMAELIEQSEAGYSIADFRDLTRWVQLTTNNWPTLSARALKFAQAHSWNGTFETYARIFTDQIARKRSRPGLAQ